MRPFWFLIAACALSPVKAEWVELPWPALGATLPVWKPDDFDSTAKYPAIVYYHGDANPPDARFIHNMTEGKDFVIVGMAYRGLGQVEREIADGLGFLNALKKTLTGSLAVDPSRIYVGGSGNGAVHCSMLLDRDRSLAGGFLIGGGLLETAGVSPKFANPVPVYIGCGRFDTGFASALGALPHFRKLGAKTTLETWPDEAAGKPEGLRQWLRINASASAAAVEASSWVEGRLAEIEAIPEPVRRWYAYEEFLALPYAGLFESDVEKGRIPELLKDPAVAIEKKWRDESRAILARESGDRLLATMQNALRSHQQLSIKAEGTQAGRDALKDVKRVAKVIESAKLVTLPGKQKPESVAPEASPSAPSANPERSPFFPPGIKVKPAK